MEKTQKLNPEPAQTSASEGLGTQQGSRQEAASSICFMAAKKSSAYQSGPDPKKKQ